MRITPLSSGSQGNSLLLQAGEEVVLVDLGLTQEELTSRLHQAGSDPREITAICVTHRHKDHIRGVAEFCATHGVPVFSSRRTLRSLSNKLTRRLHPVPIGRAFRIGALSVQTVELSHDAPQTVAFVFEHDGSRFGMATDLGCTDEALRAAFSDLDALLLEFNHDRDLLDRGPYPQQLKNRIASDRGHLSNDQAAAFLGGVDHHRLGCLWLAHLSERTNRPEIALAAAQAALGEGFRGRVRIAAQDRATLGYDTDRDDPAAPLE